jgi:hypothetical protein
MYEKLSTHGENDFLTKHTQQLVENKKMGNSIATEGKLKVSRAMVATGRKIIIATSMALMLLVATTPVPAGTPLLVPTLVGTTSISDRCFELMGNPYERNGNPVTQILIKGEALGKQDGGRTIVLLPSDCFEPSATVSDVRSKNNKKKSDDYHAATSRAKEQIKDILKTGGADPKSVDKFIAPIERLLEREDNSEVIARELPKISKDLKDDDNMNGALTAAMVAGCVALTGGVACAALGPIFGGLFGTDVSTKEIEQGVSAVEKLSRGESLKDDDFKLLEKYGAPSWTRGTLSAIQSGDIKDLLAQAAKNSGLLQKDVDVLTSITDAANKGTLDCRQLSKIAQGGGVRPLKAELRKGLDMVVMKGVYKYSPTNLSEIRRCLDSLLTGG